MNKIRIYFLLAAVVGLGSIGRASTQAQFFFGNQQVMLSVKPTDTNGNFEKDSQELINSMDVPWQSSPMGPGKGLFSSDRIFNLTCGQRPEGYLCTFVIRSSAATRIDSSHKQVEYRVSGVEAENLAKLFVHNNSLGFSFMSTDRQLLITSNEHEFILRYVDGGI